MPRASVAPGSSRVGCVACITPEVPATVSLRGGAGAGSLVLPFHGAMVS